MIHYALGMWLLIYKIMFDSINKFFIILILMNSRISPTKIVACVNIDMS
jgi:hypothetical protein